MVDSVLMPVVTRRMIWLFKLEYETVCPETVTSFQTYEEEVWKEDRLIQV
jgi:hypothetical protein